MRLVFSINMEVLGKNYVIALWIIYILALSFNLSKVINIICDWITIIDYHSHVVDKTSSVWPQAEWLLTLSSMEV